ncbi:MULTISPECIES: hypothetical protein [Pantoea]|uniref:hypothetical protein n=1 Tax=Pantoea TaxID=53335 RepID=UPI001B300795|nr:hypothetical protein [Pantoea ananatis]
MNKDKYYEMLHTTAYIIKKGHDEAKKSLSLTDEGLKDCIDLINPILELMITRSLEEEYGIEETNEFLELFSNASGEDFENHIQNMIINGDAVELKNNK